jgi:sulfite reductase (NADPH) flavoprotein alpha-component
MEESAHEIWNWLNEGAYIYICGDAKYMAKDVESVLFNLVKNFGHMDDTTAHIYLRQLRKEGRLQKDVY